MGYDFHIAGSQPFHGAPTNRVRKCIQDVVFNFSLKFQYGQSSRGSSGGQSLAAENDEPKAREQ
jgi:hypothetical protein